MWVANYFCSKVFLLANKLVKRCRSKKEYEELRKSFNRHFDSVQRNELEARKYQHVLSQKDNLFNAATAIKQAVVRIEDENEGLLNYIEKLESDNAEYKGIIALACKLRAENKLEELDRMILMLSQQFL